MQQRLILCRKGVPILRLLLVFPLLFIIGGCTAQTADPPSTSESAPPAVIPTPFGYPTELPSLGVAMPSTMDLLDSTAKVVLELMARLDEHLRDHEGGVDHRHGFAPSNDITNPAYHTHENDHNHFGNPGWDPGDHRHSDEYAYNDHTHWDYADTHHTHGGY